MKVNDWIKTLYEGYHWITSKWMYFIMKDNGLKRTSYYG